ncbi:unnamed protein product [Dracunculus medinensis]|uniref:Autophagy-related protein 13 n=1 Tax=Dracunculus medinensis TaxID=318479 RepID=A0A0N4U0P6_DRAME|nr:unnamed protein product [Dracunculus medinensis]
MFNADDKCKILWEWFENLFILRLALGYSDSFALRSRFSRDFRMMTSLSSNDLDLKCWDTELGDYHRFYIDNFEDPTSLSYRSETLQHNQPAEGQSSSNSFSNGQFDQSYTDDGNLRAFESVFEVSIGVDKE